MNTQPPSQDPWDRIQNRPVVDKDPYGSWKLWLLVGTYGVVVYSLLWLAFAYLKG